MSDAKSLDTSHFEFGIDPNQFYSDDEQHEVDGLSRAHRARLRRQGKYPMGFLLSENRRVLPGRDWIEHIRQRMSETAPVPTGIRKTKGREGRDEATAS